jgi:transposase
MVLEFAKAMPISEVATKFKENHRTIMRIIDKYVEISKANANYSNVTRVCIDETACKRGHTYITSMVDIDTKKVCSITQGK